MNNTTYTANENCFLINGEVYVWSEDKRVMLYTTDKFYHGIGVKPLPREAFVKGEDVHKHAVASYWEGRNINEDDYLPHYVEGFKTGYNAKKGEFTRDEMIKAMNAVHNNPLIVLDIPAYINHLRPLSLPASLEINEQGEIVNIQWT